MRREVVLITGANGEIGHGRQVGRRQPADVGAFHQGDARIIAQARVELAAAGIDREDMLRALGQQDMGEAARR